MVEVEDIVRGVDVLERHQPRQLRCRVGPADVLRALCRRIRNCHDLIFYRPDTSTRHHHIDSLFGEEAIDWRPIETHWTDLLRTAISIRENRISPVTLLRRLGTTPTRTACIEPSASSAGRCTITLLR
ncbi:Tn3 family transposase [Nonomuraea fuscirosea]|uniref:Tn3 family transposase n=1 Tax=Nonomuraea fuscirosea TaxID=1291556 RepID=UPI001C62F2FB|nr:Tn3 family transposase [Nonomuraea fuscirosea]